jgi:hypothetical protein
MEEGFEVHGPHDHELEHAAEHGSSKSMTSQIAMYTAIIATVGAIFGYMGGATQANAGLYKNNAATEKDRGLQPVELLPSQKQQAKLERIGHGHCTRARRISTWRRSSATKAEKSEIKKNAEHLEQESKATGTRSRMRKCTKHHRWAQATTALQISIALAAIALLTRKSWLQKAMMVMGGVGLVLGGLAAMHI